MRLIDADKLSNKTCAFGIRKCCSNCGEKRTIKNPYTNQEISCDDIRFDFLQMIDREKTVKAIPIDWIKRYASEKSAHDEMDCYWHFWEEDVLKMIDAWGKENEANAEC